MLDIKKMIESAESCLGWPYVNPGSNDRNGIDCSGLFVKIYRDQGADIYHGSNTIYRKYCTNEKGPLTSVGQLCPGMAVFKWGKGSPKKFNDDLGNFSHIGLVISTNPLKIIHASSVYEKVVIDTKIGKWAYWGKLSNVNYGTATVTTPVSHPDPELNSEPVVEKWANVYSDNGKPVKLRNRPTTTCKLYDVLPVGTFVELIEQQGDWSKVNYGNRRGWWMMSKFLSVG